MFITVLIGFCITEDSSFIVKVSSHLKFQIRQLLMFLIYSFVESLNRVIPVVRLWYMIRKRPNILEVSVLDVLYQPVFGPCELLFRDWGGPFIKTVKEGLVLSKMVLNVIIRHGLFEQSLFKCKVVMILDSCSFQIFFIVFSFNKEYSIKQSSVFVINLWHFHSKGFIPPVRVWYREDDPCRDKAYS